MDSSRRAVESYWRSRMIDAATSDEDKVTPVYKLEEICELLRSSSAGIVKEISDFVLKRLDHKSPIVKQKALRLIKFGVGKSGAEFRREMQRHSVAVRQLLHYRGKPDPLKGDALNKAVRETAQDALSAIFSNEDSKPAPAEEVRGRIEGFGNTSFRPAMEEKKSFLSEVVDIGSASIKQGISTLTQGNSQKNNDSGSHGSYKGPTLRRSLTNEIEYTDKYEKFDQNGGNVGSYGISNSSTARTWGQDSRQNKDETTNGSSSSSSAYSESKTREERLLETIVTSGGVRLQPTRDALQAFLVEALKVDAVALSIALESKLQSPSWQVRMKALCVLEAILRKSDYEHVSVVESFFNDNIDIVVQCSESPQASLREKANKVLNLLGGVPTGTTSQSENLTKTEPTEKIEMPDLIDTGDAEDLLIGDDPIKSLSDNIAQQPTTAPLVDDLFGGGLSNGFEANDQNIDLFGGGLSNGADTDEQRANDDPFADVSFHTSEDKEQGSDLFAGMTVGNDSSVGVSLDKSTGSEPFDFFGSGSELPLKQDNQKNEFDNLMAGLSIGTNNSNLNSKASFVGDLENFSNDNGQPKLQHSSGILESQIPTMPIANTVFPMGPVPYNLAPGFMFNQAYPSQPLNYGAMGGFLSQQQLLAAMANLQQLQQLGSMNSQTTGVSFGSETNAGYSPAIPDIFNATISNQGSTVTMNNSKKEETKAFDFISVS
ncbi:hypothetical protein V2J09_004554 [Rumex salicifolius]